LFAVTVHLRNEQINPTSEKVDLKQNRWEEEIWFRWDSNKK
jgi:hypothetical protein